MSATAFQRHRRELAAQLAKQEEQIPKKETKPAEGENKSLEQSFSISELTIDVIGEMEIETVKEFLTEANVKFAHNTSDAKLREKLKDAISGS